MYNVLIANTERLFAEILTDYLLTNNLAAEVFFADKSDDVACFSKSHTIHLVLSELTLKSDDAPGWLPVIKEELNDVPVLILTSESNLFIMSRVMHYGINGCLTKNCSLKELGLAMQKISNGELYFADGIFYGIMKRINNKTGNEKITNRETEIIQLLAQENTSKEIAKKLFISENTVETHRKNILSKLNVKNSAGVIKYALQNGILSD